MSDELFREVDEEVRQDQFQKLRSRYRFYLLAAVVLIVGATVAVVVWRGAQQSARDTDSTRFLAAVVQEQAARDVALEQLRDLAREGTPGYRLLASMREAGLLAGSGQVSEAIAVFDSISADTDVATPYRDMSRLLAVAHGMALMSSAEVAERLSDMAAPSNAFRVTAREFLALAAMKAGDAARAREMLQANIEDRDTPPASRARAGELLAVVGP